MTSEIRPRCGRTLTLPNGLVVRVGDVLVALKKDERINYIGKVTAVGKAKFLFEYLSPVSSPPYQSCKLEESGGSATAWRSWSEVYPDRPVPGGEKGDRDA